VAWGGSGEFGQFQGIGPVNGWVDLAAYGTAWPPGITAVYFHPSDPYEVTYAETYLNTSWTWYTDGTMSETLKRADVRTITTHEIGHWLALDHDCSVSTLAVMCPNWAAKWSLYWDDWLGIHALY
jgi:hypothetical protein